MPDQVKLTPMWGASNWWTRVGALLGLLSLAWGLMMTGFLSRHLSSCGLPSRLSNPTLAIELAASWGDLRRIVGPCEASHCPQSRRDESSCQPDGKCEPICPDKIAAFVAEQKQDYVFIFIYWAFFAYLGVVNWRFGYSAIFPGASQFLCRLGAVVTLLAASYGAYSDWQENKHILQALDELHLVGGALPAMRDFAYTKWKYLFLAIGVASPVFVFWPGRANDSGCRRSAFSQTLAWFTALVALSAAWTGVAACNYRDDQRLQIAATRLGLVIFLTTLTLATAQLWRGGTIAALNRLAAFPGFSLLASLFAGGSDGLQIPGTDHSTPPETPSENPEKNPEKGQSQIFPTLP